MAQPLLQGPGRRRSRMWIRFGLAHQKRYSARNGGWNSRRPQSKKKARKATPKAILFSPNGKAGACRAGLFPRNLDFANAEIGLKPVPRPALGASSAQR